jgi:hypothetical protein
MMLHFQQRVAILAVGSLLLMGAQSNASADNRLTTMWVGQLNGEYTYLDIRDDFTCSFNTQDNCQFVVYPLLDDPDHNISLTYKDASGDLVVLQGNFDGDTIRGDGFCFSQGIECPLPSKWTRPPKSRVAPLLPTSLERSRRNVDRGNPHRLIDPTSGSVAVVRS